MSMNSASPSVPTGRINQHHSANLCSACIPTSSSPSCPRLQTTLPPFEGTAHHMNPAVCRVAALSTHTQKATPSVGGSSRKHKHASENNPSPNLLMATRAPMRVAPIASVALRSTTRRVLTPLRYGSRRLGGCTLTNPLAHRCWHIYKPARNWVYVHGSFAAFNLIDESINEPRSWTWLKGELLSQGTAGEQEHACDTFNTDLPREHGRPARRFAIFT